MILLVVAGIGFDGARNFWLLGAVVVLLMWLYLSAYIVLMGAELNSEMEHQTARDSATGAELPMGVRGATMADTLGKPADQAKAERDASQPMRPGSLST